MFEVPTLKSHQKCCFLWCFCWWSQPIWFAFSSCQPRHGSKKGWTGEHSKSLKPRFLFVLHLFLHHHEQKGAHCTETLNFQLQNWPDRRGCFYLEHVIFQTTIWVNLVHYYDLWNAHSFVMFCGGIIILGEVEKCSATWVLYGFVWNKEDFPLWLIFRLTPLDVTLIKSDKNICIWLKDSEIRQAEPR